MKGNTTAAAVGSKVGSAFTGEVRSVRSVRSVKIFC